MHARAAAILGSLLLLGSIAACGSSGASSPATSASAAAGGVTVTDAWVRAAQAGGTSAAYLTITNGGSADDALVGASAPDVTDSASVHETTTDSSGMTGMQMTKSVAVPAGQSVALKPGGYHVMLMDLKHDLKAGDTVQLTLTFEQTGPVTVTAEVRAA